MARSLSATLLILATVLATVLNTLVSAHISMLYPSARGGFNSGHYNGRAAAFIGYKDSVWTQKFPCGGYPMGPVTPLKAGKVVNVRFFAESMKNMDLSKLPPRPSDPKKQLSQARHGGGLCQFSLSYDGGKTYHLIGQYSVSCPDVYYRWPVRIPAKAPSCKTKGKCLFVFSWTAHLTPQYYHSCADISLTGVSKGAVLPKKSIGIFDFKPYKMNVGGPGDGLSHTSGKGPNPSEVKRNMYSTWA